jgi:hypothetical protein
MVFSVLVPEVSLKDMNPTPIPAPDETLLRRDVAKRRTLGPQPTSCADLRRVTAAERTAAESLESARERLEFILDCLSSSDVDTAAQATLQLLDDIEAHRDR